MPKQQKLEKVTWWHFFKVNTTDRFTQQWLAAESGDAINSQKPVSIDLYRFTLINK